MTKSIGFDGVHIYLGLVIKIWFSLDIYIPHAAGFLILSKVSVKIVSGFESNVFFSVSMFQ